jgi:hypothetical protein
VLGDVKVYKEIYDKRRNIKSDKKDQGNMKEIVTQNMGGYFLNNISKYLATFA